MLRKAGNAKVTAQMVLEIRRDYADGMTQPQLARKYGIGPGQVGRIVRGEAWAHVTGREPVTTEFEAQLRGRELETPQGQEYVKGVTDGMLERLIAAQTAMGIGGEAVSVSESPPASTEGAESPQQRYARLMGNAEAHADSNDGTLAAVENSMDRMQKTLEQSQGKIGLINAGKLLETLTDEHTSTIVPPATQE